MNKNLKIISEIKSLLLISTILILGFNNTEAQVMEANKGKLFFGTGIGIGYVNPTQVNEEIETYFGGPANIHLAFSFEINTAYFISNKIEVKGGVLAAAAFSQVKGKDMIGMSNNKANFLTRLSPEIIGNYHFAQTYYNSFYAGGGVSYSKLALYIDSDDKTNSGNATGFLLNIGMLTQKQKHQRYIELKANLIEDKNDYFNFSGVTLNFGIRF